MDINNNTQINTFTGGMNTDTADSLMPSDQYRMAHNMRLGVKDGEQGGLLYTIEGSSDAVITDEDGGDVEFKNIIASSQIRNYGVVIDDTAEGWCVYRLELFSVGSLTATKVFGPCKKDPIGKHPTIVCRWESDDNVKAYIADGIHPIMLVNIMKDNGSDISNISSIAEHTFGGFVSINKISGKLKPAIVQYAYQLYNKYGSQSQVSPLSQCFVVRDDGENKGLPYDENSQTGFEITIDERAKEFKKIKLYRITYQQNGQQPTIDLIADAELPEYGEFKCSDTGGIELDTLSVAEFIALDNIVLVPKEIESKGDHLFASNVKYLIEETGQIIQNFYNWNTKAMSQAQEENLSFSVDYNEEAWGDVSTNVDYWNGLSEGGSCKWRFVTDTKVEESSYKSLRRGEIYRYGLVLYDKYGTAWPVKWIADIRTPEVEKCPIAEYTYYEPSNTYVLKCKSLGVRFSIAIPNTISDYFTKYEIVRCNRTSADRCTITQGILGRALETYYYGSATDGTTSNRADEYDNTNDTTNYLTPSGYMTASNMLVYCKAYENTSPSNTYSRFAKSTKDILLFSSPEYCYQKDDIQNIIKQYKSSLSVRPVCQYKNRYWAIRTGTQTESGLIYDFDSHKTYNCVAPYDGTKQDIQNKATALYTSRLRITDYYGTSAIECTEIDAENKKAFCFATWRFRQHFPYTKYTDPNRYKETDFRRRLSLYEITQRWLLFDKIVADNDTTRTSFNEFVAILPIDRLCGVRVGNFGVQDVKYVDVPAFNEFESNKNFTFKNKQVPIQGKNFIPWSVPTIANLDPMYSNILTMFDGYGFYERDFNDVKPGDYSGGDNRESIYNYPIGACGEAIILALNKDAAMFNSNLTQEEIENPLCTTVCNIRKTNTIPYGGFTDYARTHSTYYSHGVNGDVPYSKTINVYVYDGDCFIRNFAYNALKTWYSPNCKYAPNMSSVYMFPVETDIDILNDYGDTYARSQSEFKQDYAAKLRNYTQDKPAYMYNTAYSVDPNVKFFTGQDEDEFSKYKFDCRVCYSNPKTNDETTDSWLKFKSANYLDVDTRFGEITNLRLFKDTLMFWQNDAVGVLSANERTVLQDVNDTNIILGNGDILQRFDYITTQYGMKPNLYADTQSNTSLYWWDGYRKEILQFKSGQGFTPLKVAKTVAAFINDSGDADNPALCYDSKYNEILMNVLVRNIGPTYLPSTLAYNEYIEKFTGVYDLKFNSSIHIENYLYMCLRNTENAAIKVWNDGTVNSSSVEYVVNRNPQYTKVYDNMIFEGKYTNNLNMDFTTPLNQSGSTNQNAFTKIENDYRLAIPRNGSAEYGDRLRGKTMDVTITSSNDLSILHALTKYRISWS